MPCESFVRIPVLKLTGSSAFSRLLVPHRQFPLRPHEMTGVAVRYALQIILMFRLCFPEWAGRRYFSDDAPGPKFRRIHVGDGIGGDALLLVARIVDRRAIARAHVIALAVARGRIMNLEKEFEQLT